MQQQLRKIKEVSSVSFTIKIWFTSSFYFFPAWNICRNCWHSLVLWLKLKSLKITEEPQKKWFLGKDELHYYLGETTLKMWYRIIDSRTCIDPVVGRIKEYFTPDPTFLYGIWGICNAGIFCFLHAGDSPPSEMCPCLFSFTNSNKAALDETGRTTVFASFHQIRANALERGCVSVHWKGSWKKQGSMTQRQTEADLWKCIKRVKPLTCSLQ